MARAGFHSITAGRASDDQGATGTPIESGAQRRFEDKRLEVNGDILELRMGIRIVRRDTRSSGSLRFE